MGIRPTHEPLPKEWYTEDHIQKVLRQWKSQPQYIIEGLYVFRWESDFLIKTKSGVWYEVEIKISLSDFKHDFTKEEKHLILKTGYYCTKSGKHFRTREDAQAYIDKVGGGGHIEEIDCFNYISYYAERQNPHKAQRPHYFSYCVPWFLQEKVKPLIPEYAGLLVVTDQGMLKEIKKPPRIHKDKANKQAMRLEEKFYYNWRSCKDALENNNKQETINNLRYQLSALKAEFKAATGYDYKEIL